MRVALFVVILGLASSAVVNSRPFMFWRNAQSTESTNEIDDTTLDVQHVLSYLESSKKMLAFGFLFDSLDLQSLKGLKDRIENNDDLDSTFLPFVTGEFRIAQSRLGLRAENWEEFEKYFTPDTDVVVFEPQTESELNDLFKKSESYARESDRNVGFFVTTSNPKPLPSAQSPFRGAEYVAEYVITVSNTTANQTSIYQGPVSVTPFTLQALIITLIVFIGTYIGNCCMNLIQVPITYLHQELPIRKEY